MATPLILLEAPDDRWDLDEWHEELGNQRPGGAGAFSYGNSEDVLAVEVPYNKLRSCLATIFGYSIAATTGTGSSTTYYLNRPQVPIRHPLIPWLWADSLTAAPWNPIGNPDYEVSTGKFQAKLPKYLTGTSTDRHAPPYTGNYKRCTLGVRFKEAPYPILSNIDEDWEPDTPEYKRFLGPIAVQPKNELITATGGAEGSSLWFADGSNAVVGPPAIAAGPVTGPGPGAAAGTAVQGSVYTTKQQTEISLLWKQVEESYLVDTSDASYYLAPVPTRLLAYLGTVNKTAFAGKPAGTLLFDGIGLQRKQQPVLTDSFLGCWAYDVTLRFQFFDPQRPPTADIITNPVGQTPLRGWHLFPWRANGYWYAATKGSNTTQGTYNGSTQLNQKEFRNLFKYWSTDAGAYD